MLYDRMILDELAALMGMKPVSKRNKFRAKPTIINGIRFASKAEAARYLVLKEMARTKEISNLELQPKYDLPGGIKYVADFAYVRRGTSTDGKWRIRQPVTEDVKGFKTAVYKLKAKLFKEKYGRAIVETQLGSGAVDMLLKAYAGQQRREQPAPVPEGGGA